SVGGESTTAQPGKFITDILNNVTASDQTVVYTITPKSSNNCLGDPFHVSVLVHPEPKGGADVAATCSDVALSYNLMNNITTRGNNLTTGTTFTWSAASNTNVGGESTSDQSGSTINDVLNNITNVDQVVIYTVKPKTNSCDGDPFVITVT